MPLIADKLRQRVLELRKESALPWWRASYAEFLLDRADEFSAVGREEETQGTLERVEHWIHEQESLMRHTIQAKIAQAPVRIRLWSEQDLQALLHRLRRDIAQRKELIPGPERDALLSRLQRVEKHLAAGLHDEAKGELNAVRAAFVRRLTRSYRAWSQVPSVSASAKAATKRNDLNPAGPYNSRRNLDEVVNLVSERDPIWMEDFIEVYNDLMQYAIRLSDPDKKRAKH